MGFDPVSYILGRRAGAAAADPLKSWAELQRWLRAGQLGQVLEPGDQLSVGVGGIARAYDVLGLDEDEAVDPDLQHVLSIQAHGVLTSIPFDVPMYLFAVTEEACEHFGWPTTGANAGMPAGTYNVTLLCGAYDGSTKQDGTYQFTTTQVVPIGGGVRHTTMGVYDAANRYTKANLLAGTFTTYASDTVTVIETGLQTFEGTGGISLGTSTSKALQYLSGNYINFTQRQASGCNRLSWSYLWQFLNSDDAVFQWRRKSMWSRNLDSSPEGFLHSIDPLLRQVIGKVRKRVALPVSEAYGYEDLEGYCFPAFLVDLGLGANNGIFEGPVDANGSVTREEAYTFWRNTDGADRVKHEEGEAKVWWTGSNYVPNATCTNAVRTTGQSSIYRASNPYGVVPSLFIV